MTITVNTSPIGRTGGSKYDYMYAFARGIPSQEDECSETFQFFIRDRLPTWIQLENPNFTDFFAAFYEWMTCKNDVNLDQYTDIDATRDEFIKLLKNTYAPGFPDKLFIPEDYWDENRSNNASGDSGDGAESIRIVDFIDPDESKVDVRNFLHFVKDFYQMKSLEEVYEFFFRVFFDTTVDIYNPKERVFRLSDSPYRGASGGEYPGTTCDRTGLTGDDGGRTGNCWRYAPFADGAIDGYTGCWNPGSTYAIEEPGLYPPCELSDCAPGSPCGVYYWDELSTLSGYSKIQDSKIWQDYSYLLNTKIPFKTYWPIISKLIHPAGLYAAGNFTFDSTFPSPGTTGEVFPVETPIIANYTPYRVVDTANLRENENEVDLYPCGYNPYLSGGTYTSTHYSSWAPYHRVGGTPTDPDDDYTGSPTGGVTLEFGDNKLWYKDVAGASAHQPRTGTGAYAPLGLCGHTGGEEAAKFGVSFFRIYHHPNSWSNEVVAGTSFGGIQLGEFYFLTGIDNSSSPNDPSGSSAGCGF